MSFLTHDGSQLSVTSVPDLDELDEQQALLASMQARVDAIVNSHTRVNTLVQNIDPSTFVSEPLRFAPRHGGNPKPPVDATRLFMALPQASLVYRENRGRTRESLNLWATLGGPLRGLPGVPSANVDDGSATPPSAIFISAENIELPVGDYHFTTSFAREWRARPWRHFGQKERFDGVGGRPLPVYHSRQGTDSNVELVSNGLPLRGVFTGCRYVRIYNVNKVPEATCGQHQPESSDFTDYDPGTYVTSHKRPGRIRVRESRDQLAVTDGYRVFCNPHQDERFAPRHGPFYDRLRSTD